ncbi:glycine receptor subunit alphaZ1 [Hyalella azteca]|uniref:Glycine receptor subunit alphaZ1 n=1 Tax=Hyalella azteca TaxID=294128 RepID=A0A979FT08_HYAAZ|nr:glycine receptor subunit alphaZ1 [Hyalella azteca]
MTYMDYKIDVFLRQRWNDPRLRHSAEAEHFTIMDPELHKKIWKPDTYFENVKEAHIHSVTMPNQLLRVYENGDVIYSVRVTLRLSCHLELELYPFDAQKCYVKLSSYSNEISVVRYKWFAEQPIVISGDIEIAEFDLVANSTYEHNSTLTKGLFVGSYSGLTASFTLRRQNGYHILQTYIPTIMIVAISWVSFWLDPNAVPGRVTLGVTTLLTLTTLSAAVRQTLPPVSYVKAIDIWVGMCMCMVFGALLEFTFANYLANKKMVNSRLPGTIYIPSWLAGHSEKQQSQENRKKKDAGPIELLRVQTVAAEGDVGYSNRAGGQPKTGNTTRKRQGEGETYMFYALLVDRISRLLFPAIFIIFNFIYWPTFVYMQIMEDEWLKTRR